MDGHRLFVSIAAMVGITIAVVTATIWLTAELGIPSETAVPVIVAMVFAFRAAARRRTLN
jgi:hypothetical protein